MHTSVINARSQSCKMAGFKKYATETINGVKLFNALPKSLRDLTGVKITVFKNVLDNYLKSVPDGPLLPEYTKYRKASSKSV